jgi:hypothetical protein
MAFKRNIDFDVDDELAFDPRARLDVAQDRYALSKLRRHRPYPNAVSAQLVKKYAADPRTGQARYSSPVCTGVRVRVDRGDPDPDRISTSYVERQNLAMRMGMAALRV